jgi:nitroimidazol reductase NimA-like FMN-containing flavoprotein (pyridoxamine 5'-phosphate oxidase superfamily)
MTDAWLEPLSPAACRELLRHHFVGRIAFTLDEYPVVLPVNYRLVEKGGDTWIAVRARHGGVIEHEGMKVAFQIDGVDEFGHQGWSVLARGTLHHVDPDAAGFREQFDPNPWILEDRDAWLVVIPFAITGRQLHSGTGDWAFHERAYL